MESLAEMVERVATETVQTERAKHECPDCVRLRGLIASAADTMDALQERINCKDAEIVELKENVVKAEAGWIESSNKENISYFECVDDGRYFTQCSVTEEGYIDISEYFSENFQSSYEHKVIFLPSIEQMAGLWSEKTQNTAIDFLNDVDAFIDTHWQERWFDITLPLHLIVLAFLMYDLHGLTWSEEKGDWV